MDANPIQFPQAHTTDSGSLYRITELCKMKYGNRGNFECMAFSVVNQFFNNRKRLIFPDETI